jgi:hypothetical protein
MNQQTLLLSKCLCVNTGTMQEHPPKIGWKEILDKGICSFLRGGIEDHFNFWLLWFFLFLLFLNDTICTVGYEQRRVVHYVKAKMWGFF